MFKQPVKVISMIMLVALLVTGVTSAFAAPVRQAENTIVDIAVNDGRFTTLVTALQAANLVDTLKGAGPFTVFAPTDDAFNALPAGTVEGLLANIPALTDVLTYHVVPGKVMAADVVNLSSADTVQGEPISISVQDGKVMVNNAQVIITDIEASNGVIHVIDAVILPPSMSAEEEAMMAATPDIVDIAVNDGRFTTLVTALQAANLVDTLKGEGPFTVFAPTDEAFAALPAGALEGLLADIPALTDVLLYHVVSGKVMAADVVNLESATTVQSEPISISVDGATVKVNQANIIITDIEASNGVIHVIDAVILPPSMSATSEEEAMMAATPDIVDIAVNDGRFTTLVTALQAANLVDTLKGEGPFTVFAPTDEAFAALPAGTLEGLLADIPALTDVLTYHVVPGKVMAADVVNLAAADTVQSEPISISVDGATVKVNQANIIITDIEASNGVIHVIDAVILPPSMSATSEEEAMMAATPDIVDIAVNDGRFTTLVTALQAANLVDTLKGEGPFTVFAPTDEAFAALPAGALEGLLADIPALTDVLLYHVVPGKVMAADVINLQSANTVLGQPVSISVDGNTVKVNEAQVIITDIEASNGVIHVIDAVLIPAQ
mgnify:CR=1 FL=1